MLFQINSNVTETDTHRGWHNREGTIVFSYLEKGHRFTDEKEVEIIHTLCGREFAYTNYMWWQCDKVHSNDTSSTYKVKYGYDSGD